MKLYDRINHFDKNQLVRAFRSIAIRVLRHFTANDEQLSIFPFKRELSMESYLIENEGVLALDDDTFSNVQIIQEELTLKQGRKSKETDGRIDILITYDPEYIGIVELKLGELKEIHLEQLEDYLKVKEIILEEFPDILNLEVTTEAKWVGLLVGTSIDAGLARKISNGYTTDFGVSIAALTINRFRSDSGAIYVTTDTFFKDNSSSVKDRSKYRFLNNEYNKGRLVLAVLKEHISRNQDITYSVLEKQFPRKLQGSTGVFATVEEAQEIVNRKVSSRARHFLKADEIIEISGKKIVVSSQWGIGNINNFIESAQDLGYAIEIVV